MGVRIVLAAFAAMSVVAVPCLGQQASPRVANGLQREARGQRNPAPEAEPVSPGVATVSLSMPYLRFAMDAETGTLAAIRPSLASVTLFRSISAGAQSEGIEVKIGASPSVLAFKRVGKQAYFIAACNKDKNVYVIDAATATLKARIPLPNDPVGFAPVGSASVPYVYCMAANEYNPGYIHRLDLSTMTNDGPLGQAEGADMAASFDGQYIYTRRPTTSPTGLYVLRVSAAAGSGKLPGLVQVRSEHQTYPPYYTDPIGRYVACGNTVYGPAMEQPAAKVEGEVLFFHPSQPLAFSLDSKSLHVLSANSFKQLGQFELGTWNRGGYTVEVPPEGADGQPGRNTFLVNAAANQVVICRSSLVTLVDLKTLTLPPEPFMGVTPEGGLDFPIGAGGQVTLRPASPGLQFSLISGPEGMALKGNALVWKPSPSQVGLHQAVVQVSTKGDSVNQALSVSAARRSLKLEFNPATMALSRDGRQALFVGRSGDRRRPIMFDTQGDSYLSLVNVDSMEQLARRDLPVPVMAAAIVKDQIILALADADALLVLSTKDLSEVRRVFIKGRAQTLLVAGDDLLFARIMDTTSCFRLPAFTEEFGEQASRQAGTPYQRPGGAKPYLVGDAVFWDGAVYAPDGRRKLMLSGTTGLIPCQDSIPPFDNGSDRLDFKKLSPWNRMLRQGAIVSLAGQQVGATSSSGRYDDHAVILDAVPAAVSLLTTESRGQRSPRPDSRTLRLDVRDLLTAAKVADLPLAIVDQYSPAGNSNEANLMECVGDRVVVSLAGQIFCINADEFAGAQLPAPVHFTIDQPQPLLVEPGKPVSISLKAGGGTGKLQYQLSSTLPGVTINDATGVVSVDAAAAHEAACERVLKQMSGSGMLGDQNANAEKLVSGYLQQYAPRFNRLIGRDPKGIPVAIAIGITATDSQRQTATITPVLVVEVQPEIMLPRITKAVEEVTTARKAAMAARRPTDAPADAESLRTRITELEKQVTELQAQNKLLRELVSGQTKSTTRP